MVNKKLNFMRKQVIFLFPTIFFCWLFLPSCSEESNPYFYDEPTIYSESNKILFSEIIFFIKPYVLDAGQKKYIVSDTLKNISLKINNTIEKKSDSYSLDVSHLPSKEIHGNYVVTEQSVHYPVVMSISMIPEALVTAGQYADLLNDYLNLQPGIYVCQIVSFDFKMASGELKTAYTPAFFSVGSGRKQGQRRFGRI
jgi:hypothetical protein